MKEEIRNTKSLKRFWAFNSLEFECGVGMQDFVNSFNVEHSAIELAKKAGWGAVFDSKTGMQENYRSGSIYIPKKFGSSHE